MKLKVALFGSFAFIILITLITGITGINNIDKVNEDLNTVTDIATPTIVNANKMIALLWQSDKTSKQILSEWDLNNLEDLKKQFSDFNREFSESEIELKRIVTEDDIALTIDKAVLAHDTFEDKVIEIYTLRKELIKTQSNVERTRLTQRINSLSPELDKDIENAVELLEEVSIKAERFSEDADGVTYNSVLKARIGIIAAIIISILASMAMGIFIYQNIKKPLENFSTTISKASKGTLNAKMENNFLFAEFSTFAAIINNMLESLNIVATKNPSLKKYISLIPQKEAKLESSLKSGKTYFVKDINVEQALDIAQNDNKNILLISRDEVQQEGIFYLPIGQNPDEFSIDDLKSLENTVVEFSKTLTNTALILNRLDYFINLEGTKETINSILKIKDIAKNSGLTIILIANPEYFSKQNMSIFESEFESLKTEDIESELKEILKYISGQNKLDNQISFKDISQHFNITAPTTLKKLKALADAGNIMISKKGRHKIIRVTPKGEALL